MSPLTETGWNTGFTAARQLATEGFAQNMLFFSALRRPTAAFAGQSATDIAVANIPAGFIRQGTHISICGHGTITGDGATDMLMNFVLFTDTILTFLWTNPVTLVWRINFEAQLNSANCDCYYQISYGTDDTDMTNVINENSGGAFVTGAAGAAALNCQWLAAAGVFTVLSIYIQANNPTDRLVII